MEKKINHITWSDTHNAWMVTTVCGRRYLIFRGSIYTTDLQVARKLHTIRQLMNYTKSFSRLCFDYPHKCEYDAIIRSDYNAVQFFCSALRIA